MIKNHYTILAATLAGLIIMPGSAAAFDFAVGAQGGTLGTGVQITYGLTDHLNLRAGLNSYEYEYDQVDIENSDGLTYDNPTVDLDNQYLFLDMYPFSHGNLHLSLGYVMNDNAILAGAEADTGDFIGGEAADENTRVNALVTFEDGAYAGFGWGNAVKGGLIHFGLDVGVMMQGDPNIELTLVNDPTGGAIIDQDDLDAEEMDLEEEAKEEKLDMWPVISLSLSIQFF
jgi:hypothetical protein